MAECIGTCCGGMKVKCTTPKHQIRWVKETYAASSGHQLPSSLSEKLSTRLSFEWHTIRIRAWIWDTYQICLRAGSSHRDRKYYCTAHMSTAITRWVRCEQNQILCKCKQKRRISNIRCVASCRLNEFICSNNCVCMTRCVLLYHGFCV